MMGFLVCGVGEVLEIPQPNSCFCIFSCFIDILKDVGIQGFNLNLEMLLMMGFGGWGDGFEGIG